MYRTWPWRFFLFLFRYSPQSQRNWNKDIYTERLIYYIRLYTIQEKGAEWHSLQSWTCICILKSSNTFSPSQQPIWSKCMQNSRTFWKKKRSRIKSVLFGNHPQNDCNWFLPGYDLNLLWTTIFSFFIHICESKSYIIKNLVIWIVIFILLYYNFERVELPNLHLYVFI